MYVLISTESDIDIAGLLSALRMCSASIVTVQHCTSIGYFDK